MDEFELAELADRLEAHLIANGTRSQAQADFDRMARLSGSVMLTNKARRAVDYAVRSRDDKAVQIALRELGKLQDEEDFAVTAALTLT